MNCGSASSVGAAPTCPVVSAIVRLTTGSGDGMSVVTNEPREVPARPAPVAPASAMTAALASTSPQTIPVAIGGSRRRARRRVACRATVR